MRDSLICPPSVLAPVGAFVQMAVFIGTLCLTGAVPARADIFFAQADTHIRTDLDIRSNDNYGMDPNMTIGTSRGGGGLPWGAPDAERILLRFDLSGITTPFSRVLLDMTISQTTPSYGLFTVGVYPVLGAWTEGKGDASGLVPGGISVDIPSGVSWDTQPPFDSTAAAFTTFTSTTAGTVIQWDITALANSWIGQIPNTPGNQGIVLRDLTTNGNYREVFFGTKEGASIGGVNGPRLEATPVPEPTSLLLFGSVLAGILMLYRNTARTR